MTAKELLIAPLLISAMSPNPYSLFNDCMPRFGKASSKEFDNCPCCGKQRVNIYRRNGEWKCLKCWNKEVSP